MASKKAVSRLSSDAKCSPTRPIAWIKEEATKIGYEVSFTRHFYKPQELRTLDEIRADIVATEYSQAHPRGICVSDGRARNAVHRCEPFHVRFRG
jgi:hypothetical protein